MPPNDNTIAWRHGRSALLLALTMVLPAGGCAGGRALDRIQTTHVRSLDLRVTGRLMGVQVPPAGAVGEVLLAEGGRCGLEVDPTGRFSFHVPGDTGIEPLSRCVLAVDDKDGSSWLSGRLALPPADDGAASLGEVAMAPEDFGMRGAVVDQIDRVVAGAWVSAGDGAGLDLAVSTDAHGRFDLRRLGASGARSSVTVQHPGHAPYVGRPADLIVLEVGRRIRGTVALRSGMAAQDVVVHAESEVAWSAAAPRLRGAVGPAGLFEVRHVGREPQRLWASDRESGRMLGPVTRVAGAADDVEDCAIETFADARTSSTVRFELADVALRPAAGTACIVLVSDVGVRTPMERGVVQWPVPPEDATPMIGFQVPGYQAVPRGPRRDGERILLTGGHQVRLRLGSASSRNAPPGHVLGVDLVPCEAVAGEPVVVGAPGSLLSEDALWLAPAVGRYRVVLRLRPRWRWDSVVVGSEPAEIEVGAGPDEQVFVIETSWRRLPSMSSSVHLPKMSCVECQHQAFLDRAQVFLVCGASGKCAAADGLP